MLGKIEKVSNYQTFPGVKDGETFTVAGIELIKFPATSQGTPVVFRDIAFFSRFGKNNNLKESDVLERMQKEYLPKIIQAIGEENVLTFKTDLTALDGLNPYGELESKISLCPMGFYRKNVGIFDQYKVARWWWLAEPFSAEPHDDDAWVLCVAPSGFVYGGSSNDDDLGVRPFLIFESSIFQSCEE